MSEIILRDLSEVKELNEQAMISTVGGMVEYPKHDYPKTYSAHQFPDIVTQTNTLAQIGVITNSKGAAVNQGGFLTNFNL